MNIEQLIRSLQAYFLYSGMSHKFVENGQLAHVDLGQRLQAFSDRYATDLNFRTMIHAIQNWDAAFETLPQHEKALRALADIIFYDTDLSQRHLLKRWNQYCKLTNSKQSAMDAGACYGLSMTAALNNFVQPSDKLPMSINRLLEFEKVIATVAEWDGVVVTEEIENVFTALSRTVVPLQEYQDDNYQSIAGLLPNQTLPQLALGIGFVHSQATLQELLKTVLVPGNSIIFAVKGHAIYVGVTHDQQITYFDPNNKFGYRQFNLSELDYIHYAILNSFQSRHAGRISLVTKVYSADNTYDLSHVFTRLENAAGDVDRHELLNRLGPDGRNALLLSAKANLTACVNYLVQRNCNPNIRGIKGLNNAFHSAAAIKDSATLQTLLQTNQHGINSYNRSGLTPLQVAVYDNCPATVEALLSCRTVNVNKPTGPKSGVPGKTAIQMAAMFGYDHILEILAKKYAELCIMQAAAVTSV